MELRNHLRLTQCITRGPAAHERKSPNRVLFHSANQHQFAQQGTTPSDARHHHIPLCDCALRASRAEHFPLLVTRNNHATLFNDTDTHRVARHRTVSNRGFWVRPYQESRESANDGRAPVLIPADRAVDGCGATFKLLAQAPAASTHSVSSINRPLNICTASIRPPSSSDRERAAMAPPSQLSNRVGIAPRTQRRKYANTCAAVINHDNIDTRLLLALAPSAYR